MCIIKVKGFFFEKFRSSGFKKQGWTNVTKSDVYALIGSDDWLPWLESMRLRHQFSEIFSVLFMRMKSYDPITALYYAWGHLTAENSNQMKELQSRQFISVIGLCR